MQYIYRKISKMTEKEVKFFFKSFLTKGEIDDIDDRLKITQMLIDEIGQRKIAQKLGVSISSVTRGSRMLKNKSNKEFCTHLLSKNNKLHDLNYTKPFAIISKSCNKNLQYLSGDVIELKNISEIFSLHKKTLNIVPFCQIKERGFKAHGEEKIISLKVDIETDISKIDFLKSIEECAVSIDKNKLEYGITDENFKKIVQNIIDEEIFNGEGSNFVISRKITGKIDNFSIKSALSIFKNLINIEYGYYWAYIVYTGKQFFIGATPEMHLNIDDENIRMNPISGTFRKTENFENDKLNFTNFLNNKKEINELLMVVDEELKMMAQMCPNGGSVIGPLLKEMSKVIHTEYILSGKSNLNPEKIIIESMHAATLIGGPLENACRIIKKYEQTSRRYYCGMMLLIDNEKYGKLTIDGPTVIRTAEIDWNGNFEIQSGTTITKDSNPESELLEIKAKAESILNAFICKIDDNLKKHKIIPYLQNNFAILENLNARNNCMSSFWSFCVNNSQVQKFSKKITVGILDNEDSFVQMISHMLVYMNCDVKIYSYKNNFIMKDILENDLIILGPGPGNPKDDLNTKIALNNKLYKQLCSMSKPFLGICLGHQIISKNLGFNIEKAKNIMQGSAYEIELFDGKLYKVGFYNTFIAKYNEIIELKMDLSIIKNTENEILAIRGQNFASMQFHPESIFTINGYEIIFNEIKHLLVKKI